jgi:hypothetical protein
MVDDGYDDFYAAKLWQLLPAIYRGGDGDGSAPGPLQEIVGRIGAQAAIVRRSLDRLWEDQSIESCDDWVIAYIGDLLATNLVQGLDARSQRLDVAKTIYYRRRKGTLPLVEELAHDITGWEVRAVEFFRRLGRTRHGLDPALGDPQQEATDPDGEHELLTVSGLRGALTRTGAGGLADLRSVYGASRVGTAFDEFFHTADVRRGRGSVGWHGIPKLGFFLYRLGAFAVEQATPVAVASCPNQFTFDPSGRDLPLFAAPARPFGDAWQSPAEWQLPGPIRAALLEANLADLYAGPDAADPTAIDRNALAIYRSAGTDFALVPAAGVTADPRDTSRGWFVDPERGRLILRPAIGTVAAGDLRLSYRYGFASSIGAGTFDRRLPGQAPASLPQPTTDVARGGSSSAIALGGGGTWTLGDDATYAGASDAAAVTDLAFVGKNQHRPVLRFPAARTTWTLAGVDATSTLRLEGLWVIGPDLVIDGTYDEVTLSCVTLDPGTRTKDGTDWAKAVDGRVLTPTKLRVTGHVRSLVIERCITGPIEVAPGGRVEQLQIAESIVQGAAAPALISPGDEVDLSRVTLIGDAAVHRLEASESILDGTVTVEDLQHGCVRFSAFTSPSSLPRRYECAEIPRLAVLFNSTRFGDPDYAQLRGGVDDTVIQVAGDPRQHTIESGAADGSEMGAFAREKTPIKERSLLIKLQEYMPLGLAPVLIQVT